MKFESEMATGTAAEREMLLNGSILVALGLSVFVLNVWTHVAVRAAVGLTWWAFFLLLKGPQLARLMWSQKQRHG